MLREFRPVKKDWSLYEYFRRLSTPTESVFLQETHFSADVEKKWNDDIQGQLSFPHRQTSSCEVAVGYQRKNPFKLENKDNDKTGRLLIIEAKDENENFY